MSINITNEVAKNMEVIGMIKDFVAEAVDSTLLDPDDCWQPTDFLPDLTKEDALDEIKKLRERTANIPDTVICSLIGNMITEEALPSYQTYFNLIVNEEKSLTSTNGWVRWSRAWTAEENRHGDLLNKYLYLSGRCDMKAVEETFTGLSIMALMLVQMVTLIKQSFTLLFKKEQQEFLRPTLVRLLIKQAT